MITVCWERRLMHSDYEEQQSLLLTVSAAVGSDPERHADSGSQHSFGLVSEQTELPVPRGRCQMPLLGFRSIGPGNRFGGGLSVTSLACQFRPIN